MIYQLYLLQSLIKIKTMKKSIFVIGLAIACLLPSQKLQAQQNEHPKFAINAETKNQVVASFIKNLKDLYIFPEVANVSEAKIFEFQKSDAYQNTNDANDFAKLLTENFRKIINDKHIGMRFNPDAKTDKPTKADEKRDLQNYQKALMKRNFGFPKAEILRGNIGYLKVDGFAPVAFADKTASAAMAYLSNTDAIIIDLRENGGGEPAMVRFLSSYFFDKKPVHLNDLYYRKGNKTVEYWTLKNIPGTRYTNKEVYVLTSNNTFSGGEEFANNLKVLKRGTLIGETTGGGANPGDMVDLTDGFSAFIPNGRAINPTTKTNWEGVGVVPDIKTDPKNALTEAHILALTKLIETTPDEMAKGFYMRNLDFLKKQTSENKP